IMFKSRRSRGRAGFLMLDALPKLAHQVLQHQGLLPTIGQFIAIGASHGVFLWPEFAQKCQRRIFRRTPAPAAEAVFPPTHKQIEPLLVVGEADLYLHLLTAGNPAMETPAIVDDAPHVPMVDFADRPGEFAAHDIV